MNRRNYLTSIRKYAAEIVKARAQAVALILLLTVFFTFACKNKEKKPPKNMKPVVSESGKKITFPDGSQGLERIEVVRFGGSSDFISVLAPARIMATVSSSEEGGGKIILFESAENNALYSAYLHSRNAMIRATKNLARITDMYKNQVATEKEKIEAEAEASNASAEYSENQAKLRALGFNPGELKNIGSNSVLIICDVPESSLDAISRGKKVKVLLTAFPDLDLVGRADAVGDNIDPVTRTMKVRISMPNRKNQFKPGMFAKVEFTDTSGGGVLPFTSIVTVESKNYVFVETSGGTFERREVGLGNSSSDKVKITEGLRKGEDVVVKGALLLKGLSFGF